MTTTLILALPLIAATLCLAFNRGVATRWLAVAAALVMLACAGMLVASRSQLQLIEQPWIEVEGQTILLSLGFDQASLPVAVLASGGGGIALLALALALPGQLRGYGGLVSAVVFALGVTLLGLACRQPLLLPLAWAALTLFSFAALRASGGQEEAQRVPLGLLANLLGGLVLFGGLLLASATQVGTMLPVLVIPGVLLAGLLALGVPPFHRSSADLAAAPANVAAPLLAFGLPLVAGYTLVRLLSQQPLTGIWPIVLQVGGVAVIAICGAAALGGQHLRQIAAWLGSAQSGLLLLALGLGQPAAATVAPMLLFNQALTTAVALLAIGLLERRAGTDRLDQVQLSAPLVLPGLAFATAAASAVGVPGAWGFWLLRELVGNPAFAALLFGPLLGALSLLALAWLLPLVAFLRAPATSSGPRSANPLAQTLPALVALPLVMFGIVPAIAWNGWGRASQAALLPTSFSTPAEPILPGSTESIACAASIVLLLGALLVFRHSSRQLLADQEQPTSGVLLPEGLSESLRPLTWFGELSAVFSRLWAGITAFSRGFGWLLTFFEQRYFMAGLMLAVVAVILLLLRG